MDPVASQDLQCVLDKNTPQAITLSCEGATGGDLCLCKGLIGHVKPGNPTNSINKVFYCGNEKMFGVDTSWPISWKVIRGSAWKLSFVVASVFRETNGLKSCDCRIVCGLFSTPGRAGRWNKIHLEKCALGCEIWHFQGFCACVNLFRYC